MKKDQLDESENEFDVDEPDEIQNNHSDDDWTPEASGRRHSSRLRTATRKRFTEATSSEEVSEEDESDDDFKRRRSRQRKPPGRRPFKKQRVSSTTQNDNSDSQQGDGEAKSNSNSDSEPSSTTSMKVGREFASGAFVVLKTDYTNEEKPPIWKIDGKALLQKYVPFEEDGVTLYKNTSVYSGWSVSNKDQYFAATVVFKQHNRKAHVVEFKKELVKVEPGVIEDDAKKGADKVEENNDEGAEDEEEEEEEDEEEEEEEADVKAECSESEAAAPEVEEIDE